MSDRWFVCWLALSKRFMQRALQVFCLMAACSICAQAEPVIGKLVLPAGSTQQSIGEKIRVFGMPIEMQLLDIPESLAASAKFLTQHNPYLSDVAVYSDHVNLVGRIAGQRWLICLNSVGSAKTTGRVSVMADLDIDQRLLSGVSTLPYGGMTPYAWLPKGARLTLHVEQKALEQDHNVKQEMWIAELPVSIAWKLIVRGLKNEGWQVEALNETTGSWKQKQRSLHLSVVNHQSGSAIALQWHEPIKS